jgi:Ni2+-binding GTPase involved in maturation of urease and hydrogenase
VNPAIVVMQVSATRGDGMAEWLQWIERGRQAVARHQVVF